MSLRSEFEGIVGIEIALYMFAEGFVPPAERVLHGKDKISAFVMFGSALCIPVVRRACHVIRHGLQQHPAP